MGQPSKLKWIFAAVAVVCVLLLLKSFIHVDARAGNFKNDIRLATLAVKRFHSQFNAGQFQAIYNEATPSFQNAGSQSTMINAMMLTKRKYGNVIKAVQVAANAFPGGEVRLIYNTQCKNGPVTELITWQSNGQKASLVEYRIHPGTAKPRTRNSSKAPTAS